jgi:hypothetical protein
MYKPKKLKKGSFATSLSTDELKQQGATEKARVLSEKESYSVSGLSDIDWSKVDASSYEARRAGRDNIPYYEASGTGDLNNTAQQHVKNSQPIRDIAANAEFQRNRTDNPPREGEIPEPVVIRHEPRPASAGMSGKAFEAELAAMYPTPETPAQRLEREAESRNRLWRNK